MLRRNVRLRKEYLYRKSLEGKEREEYERKRKIRKALEGLATLNVSPILRFRGCRGSVRECLLVVLASTGPVLFQDVCNPLPGSVLGGGLI